MRPVAMMTPDLAMIAEVMLAAEGFREARILAKKTVTLYSLMIQQLSKQVLQTRSYDGVRLSTFFLSIFVFCSEWRCLPWPTLIPNRRKKMSYSCFAV